MAAKSPKPSPSPLPLDKLDPRDPAALAAVLTQLSPEQANAFLERLERIALRRKVQTWGYLMALLVFALGVLIALFYWALAQTWESVMLLVVPVILAALVLIGFGKWAKQL